MCNLAVLLAQAEKKVLLVNADLRCSMVQNLFGLKNEIGLTNLLVGSATLEDVLQRQVLPHLDILNSGIVPHNPFEILGQMSLLSLICCNASLQCLQNSKITHIAYPSAVQATIRDFLC